MCGFLFESSPNQRQDKSVFLDLLSLSTKRGPDHQGYWTDNEAVQMGFNRLAILELSEAGYQPMTSFTGRYVILFNGEIYNHLELRGQLSFKNFRGHSDTETITACLEEWGVEKTIQSLDGMFAIVVVDKHTKTNTLARDFAGIKPLFYGWDGKTLVAASQYDQVVLHPAFRKKEVDDQVLKLYLQQHFLPAPFGLMKDTYQVGPGEMVQFTDGKRSHKQYWEFPSHYQSEVLEHDKAMNFVHESLAQAVEDELLSDVPVGAFLSGGIDSPLVCYYATKCLEKLKTFTIGSDSKKHDESEAAEKYARLMDTTQLTNKMDAASCEEILNETLACMHEPLADFSIIPTYLVSKLARQKVTVALSGDGGDELFYGYERFWSIAKNIRYQHLPWLVKAGIYKIDQWLSGNKKVNSVVLASRQGLAHYGLHSRFSDHWLSKLFPHLDTVVIPDDYKVYSYSDHRDEEKLIQDIRKAEFYGMMQKTLRKVDLASMGNSLEVRVPFLKKSFIEASLKINPYLSYGDGKKKQLLKDVLLRNVPGSPVDEVKRGFTVPLGQWIRKDLKANFEQRLVESSNLSAFGVEPKNIKSLLEQHQNGQDLKWPVFTLTALSAWKQKLSV